jgi:hypothetical protein
MARIPAKKTAARKTTARKAPARKTTARKAPARKAPAKRAAAAPARPAAVSAAPPAGTLDLAGSLRTMLDSMDVEIRAVSALSERIDGLVRQLNDAREEQAKRLLVLDALRTSVEDANLGAFLDKAIRPRKTRVPEIVPERLTQD